jgi:hypothetical protein
MRRALPCLLLLAVLAASASAGEGGHMVDPRFREGAPSDLLEAGPPPLSRGHLNAFVDLFEAAFDIALPRDVEQALRDALENDFAAGTKADREALLDLVDGIVNIRCCARCCNNRGVRRCLRAFRVAIDRRLRKAPGDAANRILSHALERRHKVTWLGRPEVKALSADAYLEAVQFVASLGRNEEIQLTPGQLAALRDYLGRDLRPLPEAVRAKIARSHHVWLHVKARWDRSRDARRLAMRWEAVRLMARLVPRTGGMKIVPGPGLKEYAREAARVAAADRPYDAVTALARNPELLFEALDRGLDLARDRQVFTFMYR